MPPKAKISREMIAEAGMQLVREGGITALNARAAAKKLGCSTQPVLYHYKNMQELKAAVYAQADAFHTAYLEQQEHPHPLLNMGLRYIRFGAEEPHLFRFLFQSDLLPSHDIASLLRQPEVTPMVMGVAAATGLPAEDALRVFSLLFLTVHGCASLLANNSAVFDPSYFTAVLEDSLTGAVCAVRSHQKGAQML